MRTNIDIDDDLLAKAMQAGPFTTKKDTVEAGLRLLARQAAYREVLKWEGKLKWEGNESIDWTEPASEDVAAAEQTLSVQEPRARYQAQGLAASAPQQAEPARAKVKRRAGR